MDLKDFNISESFRLKRIHLAVTTFVSAALSYTVVLQMEDGLETF